MNPETMTHQQLEAELTEMRTPNGLTREQLDRMNVLMAALDEMNAEE